MQGLLHGQTVHQICVQVSLEQLDSPTDDGNSLVELVFQVLVFKVCNCLNDVHAD